MNGNVKYYPLTHPQKGIWYTEKLYPGTSIGNIAATLKIKGYVDYAILGKAINLFIERNDGIRIRITENAGVPQQYPTEYRYHKIDFFDFSDKNITELYKWDSVQTQIPFNLLNSELFYFAIIKIDENDSGFFLKIHHILSDAWSFVLLVNQVMDLYDSLMGNGGTSLKKPASYIEYIANEQSYTNSAKFQKDKGYWNTKFKDLPDLTTLRKSLLNDTSTKAKRKTFAVPQKLSKSIREYCAQNRTSLFSLFLASLSIYCNRTMGKEDVIIGTPVLNRSNAMEKETIGMFISTVPIRIGLHSDMTFADFLKCISTEWMESLRHQKYSHDLLLKDLRVNNKDIEQLFDIVLSYQNAKMNKGSNGIELEGRWHFNGHQKHSLNIHINDREGSGNFVIDYDYLESAYYSREIDYIHDHILRILWHGIDNSAKEISKIDMMSEKERQKILFEFNNTETEYLRNTTIHQLFEKQAEETPENIAVVFEDQQLSYRELNEKSNQLAGLLREKGIKQDSIVGLMLGRSPWMIISILGILKAGGSFLPCDPEYPDERIGFMLKDSNAELLILQKGFEARIDFPINTVEISDSAISSQGRANPVSINKPSDLAYIIYTSGSTGNPKGVMIEHKAVNCLVEGLSQIMDFSPGVSILSITTMSFDVFIFDILPSIVKGLKIVLANEEQQKVPKLLGKLIQQHRIEKICTTPSRIQMMAEDDDCKAGFKHLKEIIAGGEVFTDKLLYKLKSITDAKIFNGYGPTETTVGVTFKEVSSAKDINIGKPIANARIYILDKHMNPLPIGVPGEIYIGGESVGRGYLNRPELTAERFIENPFAAGERMFKTGDLGRWYPEGEIQFIGRMDYQVKIRGYRIELNEIENRLLKYEYITEAVVFDKTDNNGYKYLCAYIVSPVNVRFSELRQNLSNFLPKYMIPTSFVQIAEMPLTQGGKVDRNALPEPQYNSGNDNDYEAPADELEERIVEIWQTILGHEKIGMKDNIFDLGADSLDIIAFISKVSKVFSVEFPLAEIYNALNIGEMKNYIVKSSKRPYIPIKKVAKQKYYPLSSSQKRLYILSLMEENSTAYNMPWITFLEGLPDIGRLETAFKALVQRHDSFKTSFGIEEGEPVQIINEDAELNIRYGEADEAEIEGLAQEFVRPFALNTAPLVRVKIIKLSEARHVLMFDMHHILSDGVSADILMKEMDVLYNGGVLPDPRIQYKDYVFWMEGMIKTEYFQKQKNFWTDTFSGEIPILNLPLDFKRPQLQNYDGSVMSFKLGKHMAEEIKTLASKTGTTLYMILLAAYNVLLWKYTGQEETVVGTPVAGRRHTDLDDVVGVFINTLAIKNRLTPGKAFIEFLDNVRLNVLNAFENQDYPFEELISNLRLKRDLGRNPLFDTMLTFQRTDLANVRLGELKLIPYASKKREVKIDLSWEAFERDNDIYINIEYCTGLFSKKTIKAMTRFFKNILKVISGEPQIRIEEIEILGKVDRLRILKRFNNTGTAFDRDKTIHKLFQLQASKTPEATALIFEKKKISYRELDEKSNQLARILLERGVKPDSIVGILAKRSVELMIAILGVLKAGGAYLPVDPEYPLNRINYILEDSKIDILLTQKNLKQDKDFKGCVLNIDDEALYTGDAGSPAETSKPENLAYVIYTSGSTGNPKGVMLKHKSVCNFIKGVSDRIDFSPFKTILAVTTVSFDIFVLETILPLTQGMKVVIANEKEQVTPHLLYKLIEENAVDMVQMTPSRMKMLIDNLEDCEYLRKLSEVMIGGEAFPEALLERVRQVTDARIFNMYGPTETTVWSTIKDLTKSAKITIGTPIANTNIYILDRYLKPVPVGVAGELYIGGEGLARGYINKKELTEARFPEVDIAGLKDRIYCTGDLARWLNDGEIEYLGRGDYQLKIRGFRIEPAEIENKLTAMFGIKEAVVVDKADSAGNKFLCAYLVTENDLEALSSDIRLQLSNVLPEYMIPSQYRVLDSMPLTPNGKIDRKLLPDLNEAISSTYKAPENETEEILAKAWAEALQMNQVGIRDNFFELGGDSLSAILVQTKLYSSNLGIELQDFYKYQTIREMAEKINTRESSIAEEAEEVSRYEIMEALEEVAAARGSFAEESYKINGILLTGSTGFFGVHLLYELLKEPDLKIYCLVRGEDDEDSRNRLKGLWDFYFAGTLQEFFDKRVIVVKGDITLDKFGLSAQAFDGLMGGADIIVHAAANVRHYGEYKSFESINVGGTGRVVDYALKYEKILYHVSTMSVSDAIFNDNADKNRTFDEKVIYNGRSYSDNVYVRSKLEAEKLVYAGIKAGLRASIFRVGNLTGRLSDGFFQKNIRENAFYNALGSLIKLKALPMGAMEFPMEFTPVDSCCIAVKQILMNSGHVGRIFHLFNHNTVYTEDILACMNELDYEIELLDTKDFMDRINSFSADAQNQGALTGIMQYLVKKDLFQPKKVKVSSSLTTDYLSTLGFNWKPVDRQYLGKIFGNMVSSGFLQKAGMPEKIRAES